jgi:TonB family protein
MRAIRSHDCMSPRIASATLRIPPQYPDLARQLNLTGTAQVQAVVKPDGTAKEVKTVGAHPLLVDALARAVKQWKYQRAPNETVELVKFSFTPQ